MEFVSMNPLVVEVFMFLMLPVLEILLQLMANHFGFI